MAARIARSARGGRPAPRRRRHLDPDQEVWSPSGPSERDPQPAGGLLDRLIQDRGWRRQMSIASLRGHWADYVGQDNARHSWPESFREGQLLVRADSTTWATALRLIAPALVARLNEVLGQGMVQRVTILGPQAPSWKKGPRSVPGRGPRDTYG